MSPEEYIEQRENIVTLITRNTRWLADLDMEREENNRTSIADHVARTSIDALVRDVIGSMDYEEQVNRPDWQALKLHALNLVNGVEDGV